MHTRDAPELDATELRGGTIDSVKVQVLLFALLREHAGRSSVEVQLDDEATVADAIGELAALPGLDVLDRMPVRLAVNRDYATLQTRLQPQDELALIPPVSGGAPAADELAVDDAGTAKPRIHARVTPEPLSADALARAVADPAAGAIVTFQGLPRDIASLDYEAYVEMAQERIAAILAECRERHGLLAAAAEHRTGSVPALEPSIIVAVSAPHRGEAFAGAREALDRIKAEAPIWKVEVAADGSRARVAGVVPS
jgi:MoaE-MoaD fusion protein